MSARRLWCAALCLLACACASPQRPQGPPPEASPEISRVHSDQERGCAIRGGALWCWRMDDPSLRATQVAGLERDVTDAALHLSPHRRELCAIKAGALWCAQGEAPLAPVAGLEQGVTHLALGPRRSCAIRGGALWCWRGDEAARVVEGLEAGVHDVAAWSQVCALQAGELRCLEEDDVYTVPQLGGELERVDLFSPLGGCALRRGGLWCWMAQGSYNYVRWPTDTPLLRPELSERGELLARVWQPHGAQEGVTWLDGRDHGRVCAMVHGALRCWDDDLRSLVLSEPATSAARADLRRGGLYQACHTDGRQVWCVLPTADADERIPGAREIAPLRGMELLLGGVESGCGRRAGALWCWGTYPGALPTRMPPLPADALEERGSSLCERGGARCWQVSQAAQDRAPTWVELEPMVSNVQSMPPPPAAPGHSPLWPEETRCEGRADGLWCAGLRPAGILDGGQLLYAPAPPWRVEGVEAPVSLYDVSHRRGCAVDAQGVKYWGIIWEPPGVMLLDEWRETDGRRAAQPIIQRSSRREGDRERSEWTTGRRAAQPIIQWVDRALPITGIEGEALALSCERHLCALTTRGVYCWDGYSRRGATARRVAGMPAGATRFERSRSLCVRDAAGAIWCHDSEVMLDGRDAPREVVWAP